MIIQSIIDSKFYMKKYLLIFILVLLSGCQNKNNFRKQFHGEIDNKYPITMQINSTNGKIIGFYYYDKFKNRIDLKGEIKNDSIILNGTDSNGKLIDLFKGVINSDLNIEGYWEIPGKNKVSTFYLKEVTSLKSNFIIYTISISLLITIMILVFLKIKKSKKAEIKMAFDFNSKSGNIEENLEGNFEKGLEFEKFITSLFPKQYYNLLDWRSDKNFNGIYPDSNKKPDLFYKRLNTNVEPSSFAVECKYRKAQFKNGISICKNEQLARYKKFEENGKTPVFIILGMGGEPNNPLKLFIIGVNDIDESFINFKKLKSFEVNIRKTLFYDPNLKTLK